MSSKKKTLRLASLSVLSALMMAPRAEAQIPITAFKNVTKHFRKGQEFNSPVLGEAALLSGLMYDLRLYGNVAPGMNKNGERTRILDKGQDDIERLVIGLFPSPTGALNIETTMDDNFGKYASPDSVALLLNFAHKIRKREKFTVKSISNYTGFILETLSQGDTSSNMKTKVNGLLKAIQESIGKEEGSPYPKGTTEQVITAFFCEKFNTRQDIKSLLEKLDPELVDPESVAHFDPSDMLEINDLDLISKNTTGDTDDLFALLNAEVFYRTTPYKEGNHFISNGNTRPFDRRTGEEDIRAKTFADCAEIAAHHVGNLLLFDPKTKQFNLAPLIEHVKAQATPNLYFEKFLEFYQRQTPLQANDGSIDMRSLWARVVGDLNVDESPVKIRYLKSARSKENDQTYQYELDPGFINFVHVFSKIFGLDVKSVPQEKEARERWLEDSLKTLFKTMNPNYDYDFNLSKVTEQKDDLEGTLGITVRDASKDEELFSFSFYAEVGRHSDVKNLRMPTLKDMPDYSPYLKTYQDARTEEDLNTTKESLWLLSEVQKELKLSPLYRLFSHHLSDNTSRIEALKMIEKDYAFLSRNPFLTRTLECILDEMPWEDRAVLEEVSPVISDLMKITPHILPHVKGFNLSQSEDTKNLHLFPNLTHLFVGASIESLDLSESLPHLETLDMAHVHILRTLSLKEAPQLRILKADQSSVEVLELPESLPHLETLDISGTYRLKTLSLKDAPRLRILKADQSSVGVLELPESLPHLETLDISDTVRLKTLTLKEAPRLRILKADQSSVGVLELPESLPHLETLDISSTRRLKTLSLKDVPRLRILKADQSSVGVLELPESLPHLETLDVSGASKLGILVLTEAPRLRILNAAFSSVRVLALPESLPHLETLDITKTTGLKILSLKDAPRLRILNADRSSVRGLALPESLPHLETLDVSGASKLGILVLTEAPRLRILNASASSIKVLALPESLPHLETLDISKTTELETLALKDAPHLKKLNLESSSVTSLDVTEDMKDLALDLRGSGITNKAQIKGFEHLDETKIQF